MTSACLSSTSQKNETNAWMGSTGVGVWRRWRIERRCIRKTGCAQHRRGRGVVVGKRQFRAVSFSGEGGDAYDNQIETMQTRMHAYEKHYYCTFIAPHPPIRIHTRTHTHSHSHVCAHAYVHSHIYKDAVNIRGCCMTRCCDICSMHAGHAYKWSLAACIYL